MVYVNLILLLGKKQLIAHFSEMRKEKTMFIENPLCAMRDIL